MKAAAVYFLVMQVCGYEPETDRYTRDCKPVEFAEPATWRDCNDTAQWHRETAPAGVRVIGHACVRTPGKTLEVARQ